MNSPRPSISIVLADDHPVVLHGMAGILRAQPDINVVALCGDGIAAAEAIRRFVPDIAVLDISMPGLNGLDVLSRITSDGLATKVIFLSAAATDSQILTAITRGAKGIMLKDIAPESLADCVRQVASGQQWFPADVGRCCHGARNGASSAEQAARADVDATRAAGCRLAVRGKLEQNDSPPA